MREWWIVISKELCDYNIGIIYPFRFKFGDV